MPIDPRIALGVQPIETPSPMETAGKFLSLRSLLDARDLQELQKQQLRHTMQKDEEKLASLRAMVQTLPPDQQAAAMLDPATFIKDRYGAYNLRPGEQRRVGGQVVAEAPHNPVLATVGVEGQPGATQSAWAVPGQPTMTPIGAPKLPVAPRSELQTLLIERDAIPPTDPRRAIYDDKIRKLTTHQPAASTKVVVNPMRETFKDEQALRQEYSKASETYQKLVEGYSKVKGALASNPTKSAPATLAAATQFMKMLDPDSVVRESELQMALQSTGLMDRVLNIHNQIANGKVLTEQQVGEVGKIADVVYNAAQVGQKRRRAHYQDLSRQYNFNPERVAPDYSAQLPRAAPAAPKPGMSQDGYLYKGGDPSKPESWVKKP